jgi:hypothetical protein
VFDRSDNTFETDKFVKDPVFAFIEFDVIKLLLLIFVDVILFVCKLPLDMILPFIVWFPEHTRLFAVVILLIFDYIIIIDYIF